MGACRKIRVVTLVTNQFGKTEGIIVTRKDIATSYMDVFDNHVLSQARNSIKILRKRWMERSSLEAEHAYFVRGEVVVATSNPEYMAIISKMMTCGNLRTSDQGRGAKTGYRVKCKLSDHR